MGVPLLPEIIGIEILVKTIPQHLFGIPQRGQADGPLPICCLDRKPYPVNGIASGHHLLFKLLPVLGIGQAVFHILPQRIPVGFLALLM